MTSINSFVRDLSKSKRAWILLALLIVCIVAIYPFPQSGVSIRGVDKDSSAASQIKVELGRPMSYERVLRLDNQQILNEGDYYDYLSKLNPNTTIRVETNKNVYRLSLDEKGSLGLSVVDAPSSNIRKGLDLEGGSRVFLQPEEEVTETLLDDAATSLELRLNAFGLSNVVVRKITTPIQYIVVEIGGTTPDEVKDLLLKQGKFEAKIANETAFTGLEITSVGQSAQQAGLTGCESNGAGGYNCGYQFSLSISRNGAERFAEITKDAEIIGTQLSKNITFYLDDVEINSLGIQSSLRGQAAQMVQITGNAPGESEREARENARQEMKKLQTILKSGSLPVKLKIAQSERISPALGKEFAKNSLFVGGLAIITVAVIMFIAYRRLKIVIPIIFTMVAEILGVIGIAALMQWQIDLAAIAGIIIAAGTGVDDQIVIVSEILKKDHGAVYNWKDKMKRAFFIIIGSYLTVVVATIPLAWAGAGLLKGFAFSTIIGVSVGVLLTRPVFSEMLESLMK